MPISDHMAIVPIGGTFRAFGPPALPAAATTQPAAGTPATPTPAGQLPSQSTLDAIRQALAMMTASDGNDTSTDPSAANDPLAAILSTTDQTDASQATDSTGSLGLDTFA
jgi:hypothetical protein